MTAKKGRLSALIPGYGRECIFSSAAESFDGLVVMSTNFTCPFAPRYGFDWVNFRPIFSRVSNSSSRNSIGQRVMVIFEPVTMAVAKKNIASVGSSARVYSISVSIELTPVTVKVVVPTPSICTPSFCKNTHISCTI